MNEISEPVIDNFNKVHQIVNDISVYIVHLTTLLT